MNTKTTKDEGLTAEDCREMWGWKKGMNVTSNSSEAPDAKRIRCGLSPTRNGQVSRRHPEQNILTSYHDNGTLHGTTTMNNNRTRKAKPHTSSGGGLRATTKGSRQTSIVKTLLYSSISCTQQRQ